MKYDLAAMAARRKCFQTPWDLQNRAFENLGALGLFCEFRMIADGLVKEDALPLISSHNAFHQDDRLVRSDRSAEPVRIIDGAHAHAFRMGVKRSGGLNTKLQKIAAEARRQVRAAVYEIAGDVQSDAQISLSAGSVSGKRHEPSAPGTPPNSDTGHLADSIEVELIEGDEDLVRARVVVHAEYGAIQELGGTINHPGGQPYFIKDGQFIPVSKDSPAAARLPKTKPHTITLPERPYMRPAAAKNREPGLRKIKAALARALRT